jgi:hypothetical protein
MAPPRFPYLSIATAGRGFLQLSAIMFQCSYRARAHALNCRKGDGLVQIYSNRESLPAAAAVQRRKVEWLKNDESERKGKEVFVACCKVMARDLPEGTEEKHYNRTWVRITGVRVEIRTEHLPNTSRESNHYTNLLDIIIIEM